MIASTPVPRARFGAYADDMAVVLRHACRDLPVLIEIIRHVCLAIAPGLQIAKCVMIPLDTTRSIEQHSADVYTAAVAIVVPKLFSLHATWGL